MVCSYTIMAHVYSTLRMLDNLALKCPQEPHVLKILSSDL